MTLLIGCPVRRRAWILPMWFTNIEIACREAGISDYGFVFVADQADTETITCLATLYGNALQLLRFHMVYVDEPPRDDVREWSLLRYEHMTWLRNQLLAKVRDVGPDLFWSVDSDVLVHPQSLRGALEQLELFDAVGSKCYLSKGKAAPNYGVWGSEGRMFRRDQSYVLRADVLMAVKLMTPPAYNVDYEVHHRGEDIGWSKACRRAGLRFGWDGRFSSIHVMEHP